MRTIVTGFVDNPEGRQALDLAVEEARRRDAKLMVVHSLRGGSRTEPEEYTGSTAALAEVKDRLGHEGIAFDVVEYIRGHTPADDVLAAAAEYDAELIVIGYRKRSATGKLLLGSNALDILMGAPCPVLAIMEP